jgi:hypothetical protein
LRVHRFGDMHGDNITTVRVLVLFSLMCSSDNLLFLTFVTYSNIGNFNFSYILWEEKKLLFTIVNYMCHRFIS